MRIIDSHQHFWKYDPVRDAWIDDSMTEIRKDFLPIDLEPILKKNSVDGCVAVQADQSEEETTFLLHIAHDNPFVKGVVGWVDLLAEHIGDRLAFFSENPFFKGVRHIVQAEPKGFMLGKDFQKGVSKLKSHGLPYDILIHHNQLGEAKELVAKFEDQTFVIDHLGKPNIKEGGIKEWRKDIIEISRYPHVYCKLSGMVTEAIWKQWSLQDFEPYVDAVLESFGPKRVLFGSDWPVCKLSATYKEVIDMTKYFIKSLSVSEKNKIMGENAAHVYNLQ